ncbi:MAG: helix-turn-helix domain-containing protein [Acidimicrobiia bacterium]
MVERLHVHPSTPYQRLARLDALLGPRWREEEHALEVQVALRLRAIRAL